MSMGQTDLHFGGEFDGLGLRREVVLEGKV